MLTDRQRLSLQIQGVLVTFVKDAMEKEMQKYSAGHSIRSMAVVMEELGSTAMLAVCDAFVQEGILGIGEDDFTRAALEVAREVFKYPP